MTARMDISNQRFGRWTVLSHAGLHLWNCRCDCGNAKSVDAGSLRSGRSNGCIKCHPALGNRRTHGQKRTRIYTIWNRMKGRCENPADAAFPRYGGRGITVCEDWRRSFETFRDWALANGYEAHLTIDRRDNNLGYTPANCWWATYAQQNRNSRRNRPVIYKGRSVLVCDLAIEVGLPQDVLKNRILRYGWPIELAVSTPVLPKGGRRPTFTVEHRNIDTQKVDA